MKNTIKSLNIESIICFKLCLLCLFLISCTNPPRVEEPEIDQSKFGVHLVVFPEETPSVISAWYTDSPNNWVKFFVLKKNVSHGPYLPLGAKVYIPADLLKRKSPLPLDFIKSWRQQHGTPKSKNLQKANSKIKNKEDSETKSDNIEPVDGDQLIENLIGSDTDLINNR